MSRFDGWTIVLIFLGLAALQLIEAYQKGFKFP